MQVKLHFKVGTLRATQQMQIYKKIHYFCISNHTEMDAIVDFFINWGYWGLFLAALVAGSILPFSSEVVLTVLVQMGLDPMLCLISASIGNTLGGLICYWLGWLGNMQWIERWLKVKQESLDKVERFVRRYGAWMGLFSALPWVGEAIVVLLGLMRSNVYLTTLTMLLGKAFRYALIILAIEGVNSLL